MDGQIWPVDDTELLRLLADAIADQPPAFVLESARAVYTWRTVDAELNAMLGPGSAPEPAAVEGQVDGVSGQDTAGGADSPHDPLATG